MKIKSEYNFFCRDYGGFVKSPFGNSYNKKFLLFSIVCQINFVINAVNEFIEEETSTKLRFSYLLYYYICDILSDINTLCCTAFAINNEYYSAEFRNAMAHYKLGIALKENEVKNDCIFGLSQKILGIDCQKLKMKVINELKQVRDEINAFLKIPSN